MTSLLSKAPDALLGTLDLKNLGQNPGAFGDVLSPGLECLEFYLLRNRVCFAGQGAWVAVGTAIVMASTNAAFANYFSAAGAYVVPATECHRIKQLMLTDVRAAADAGLTLELAVLIKRTYSNAQVPIGSAVFGPRPATDLAGIQPVQLTQPLWLGPGDQLTVIPNTTQTAAGSTIRLSLDADVVPSG